MVVMGIDCASKKTGIAIMSNDELLYKELYESGLPPRATDVELSQALGLFRINLLSLCDRFHPDKFIVELTGVTRNANTMRLISYFEGACILVADEVGADLERIRTKSVRKRVFGNGAIDKADVVKKIIDTYGEMSEDEAEAVVFALYGDG
jgi:Holliday junction resolvasome RuvABC endonuclease subunit